MAIPQQSDDMKIDVNNKTREEILTNYENSFVNNYEEWVEIMNTINNTFKDYIEGMDLDIDPEIIIHYEYDEFCQTFLEELKKIMDEFGFITHDTIYAIFDTMIFKRLSEYVEDKETYEIIQNFIF